MPRQPRIKDEFSLYHVILRGNERKKIFENDGDKREFLSILNKSKEKYNFLIHAYCIMDNHVHLIINSNGNDISLLMKSINISYALYYNNKYKRCGHLFQDRFKSERIDDDTYLLQLSKYIHRNPVKAGIVREAGDYYWSSFRLYIEDKHDSECLVETDKLLSQIAMVRTKAIQEYLKFVSEKDDVAIMDVDEDNINEINDNHKAITDIVQAERELSKLIAERGIGKDQYMNALSVRNDLIKEIRRNSTLKMKEIGELFGGICESQISRIINS
jgi:REP element-mobilizing transposase RayT